jgi:ATP-dependent Clp protease ATP-binding subunit ClpB
VIILTSNLGCGIEDESAHRGHLGFGPRPRAVPPDRAADRPGIMAAVRQAFRPELVNRIDRCVVFNPLTPEAVRRIVDKFLGDLRDRLRARRIDLDLSPSACEVLMAEGYDPAYGAREMGRVIERRIVQPLGKALLEGRFGDGDRVHVIVANGSLTFQSR